MSAAELRQAAEAERREWGGEINARIYGNAAAIHLALADWLDDEAGRVEMAAQEGADARLFEPALRLARLILGGAS